MLVVKCPAHLMGLKPPKELLDLLKAYDRGIQELTLALRELVIEELAPCHEYILEVYIISLSYGPTDRLKDGICYIGVQGSYINLGFHHGTSLRDPQGILEGTGKHMRHIKIRTMEDLLNPTIRVYLQEASERAGHETTSDKVRTVTTTIKRKSSAKRSIGVSRL
jgi:hypothetical protein